MRITQLLDEEHAQEAWQYFLSTEARLQRTMVYIMDVLGYQKAVNRLVQALVRDYVHQIKKQDADEKSVLELTSAVETLRQAQLLKAETWKILLWSLSSSILLSKGNLEAEAEQVQQLMRLWHMCFFIHLSKGRDQSEAIGVSKPWDWTFLPSPEWAQNMVQRNSGRTFHDVLQSLTPRPNNTGSNLDFASPALLTYDLLLGRVANASTVEKERYAPFVRFVNSIRKATSSIDAEVPGSLKRACAESIGDERHVWESLFRRLGYVAPPQSTTASAAPVMDGKPHKDPVSKPALAVAGDHVLNVDNHVVTNTPPPSDNDSSEFEKSAEAQRRAEDGMVVSQDTEIPELRVQDPTDKVLPTTAESVANISDDETRLFVGKRQTQLGKTQEQSDLYATERIWKETKHFVERKGGGKVLPLNFYEHLLRAFLALRRPSEAIEVWNDLIQHGHVPTARTWTVMMRGAQQGKDINTSESFWSRMRASGVQPDAHAWSTKIFGLFKTGRAQQGMAALQEMGREWIAAAQLKQNKSLKQLIGRHKKQAVEAPLDLAAAPDIINGVPKPSLVVVNSAVSAIGVAFSSGRDDYVGPILRFARSFGIEPDVITYNALINISLRNGLSEEAVNILQRMEERGMQPDSDTFTILLQSLFKGSFLDGISHEEQQDKVINFINTLESTSGAGLDLKAYGLLIDRLLKEQNNPLAAHAILSYMSSKGIQPGPHIYTILFTHYFQANPPDFAAAEALWNRIQASDNGYGAQKMDVIFYDRMVESYAEHHWHAGIGPALNFLQRMSKVGKRPGWPALEMVARALAERNDWDRLAEIVHDVRKREGLISAGMRGMTGQRSFWEFVLSTGLLRDEGVRSVKDVEIREGESSFGKVLRQP